ncbi:MAG: hypothetical protein AAF502_23325 [Bacteroidota bacterium]
MSNYYDESIDAFETDFFLDGEYNEDDEYLFEDDQESFNDDFYDDEGYSETDESNRYGSIGNKRKTRRGPKRRKPVKSNLSLTVKKLKKDIRRLYALLQQKSKQHPGIAQLAKKITKLEEQLENQNEMQLLSTVLDLPQLKSIKFDNEEKKLVDSVEYDHMTSLMLSMMNNNGLTSGKNGGSSNQFMNYFLLSQLSKDGSSSEFLPLVLLSGMFKK